MVRLVQSLQAWGTPDFATALKQEIAQSGRDWLPLQQGLSASSSVADAPITLVVLGSTELENAIQVRAGIFYQGLIGGCSCVDDPTPDSENTEYCEVLLEIDKATAEVAVSLLTE